MVQFLIEHNHFTLPFPDESLNVWLDKCAKHRNLILGDLFYIFVTDDALLQINIEFLNHRTLTDIITFDQSTILKINGEIYISVDRLKENCKIHKVSHEDEFLRLLAHGFLHLGGFKDKTVQDKRIMRENENECIQLYKNSLSNL